MNRLKKFAKYKWHAIPIGAVAIALIASMAITGTAYGLVHLLSGSATVTVQEAITVSAHTPTDGTWSGTAWTVSTYPAETKNLTLKLTNIGTADIPVTISITDNADLTESIKVWDGASWVAYGTSYTIIGSSVGYVQFQVTASVGSSTGDKSLTITIDR